MSQPFFPALSSLCRRLARPTGLGLVVVIATACAQPPASVPAVSPASSSSSSSSSEASVQRAASAGLDAQGMGFFVTSTNPGRGGDLGGLAGADAHCQFLATTAGAGQRTWRAYLSTRATLGGPPVHARERIGRGPWRNVQGVLIARNVEELHSPNSNLSKQTALTERGELVSGRGDAVNLHDILTGSSPEGRAVAMEQDTTCGNWTSSGLGAALVGHHDRRGLTEDPPALSWNSSHLTRGCSMEAFKSTGGAGLLYCFAVD